MSRNTPRQALRSTPFFALAWCIGTIVLSAPTLAQGMPRETLLRGSPDAMSVALSPVFGSAQPDGSAEPADTPRRPPSKKAPKPAAQTPQAPQNRQASGWSIVLASFRGENQGDLGRLAVDKVRRETPFDDVRAEVRGPATVVLVGTFPEPTAADAKARLEAIRSHEVGGARPFAGAFFCPPVDSDLGGKPEYNLAQVRTLHGPKAVYTLQVAAYGPKDISRPVDAELRDARRDAEAAAARLRREGELAWFYHGPNRSMVTIGVFTPAVLEGKNRDGDAERAVLADLERRFPHNLYNGGGVQVKRGGLKNAKPQLQSSTLVAIPE